MGSMPGRRVVFPAIVAILAALAWMSLRQPASDVPSTTQRPAPEPAPQSPPAITPAEPTHSASPSGNALVAKLFATRRSNVEVEIDGTVAKTLADDRQGSPHQRFLVRVPGGPTVLVAHNIDIAPRAPVRQDRPIRLRGEYVWNAKGGIVHWTHHDPVGRHANGWIEVDGHRYE